MSEFASSIFSPYVLEAASITKLFQQLLLENPTPGAEDSHIAFRLGKPAWESLKRKEHSHPHRVKVTGEPPARQYIWLYFGELPLFNYLEFPEPHEASIEPVGAYAFIRILPEGTPLPPDKELTTDGLTMRLRHFHTHARQHSGLGSAA